MRKILAVVLFALIALCAMTEGMEEQTGDRYIRFAYEGIDWECNATDTWYQGGWLLDNLIPQFERETGITVIVTEYPCGKPELQDADLKSDEPFDVFNAYASRISRLMDYSVDLYDYIPEYVLGKFIPAQLEQWVSDGKLFGLPHAGWTAFFCVDTTVTERVGFEMPDNADYDRSWSIDQFNDLLARVKGRGDGMYGTYLFAGDRNGDYWSAYGFFAGFGAKLYENGRPAFDSPEARQALAYLKWLQTEEHVPPGIAGYMYSDSFNAWKRNAVATIGGNLGHVTGMKQQGLDAEMVTELHTTAMMEWPSATGNRVPIMYGPDAVCVIDNGDPQRIKDAALFAEYLSSPDSHFARSGLGKWSPLFNARKPAEPLNWWKITSATMKSAGVYDMGAGFEGQTELRNLLATMLQGFFNDDLDIEGAIEFWTDGADRIIGR